MNKSVIIFVSLLVILLPIGTSNMNISNTNAIADFDKDDKKGVSSLKCNNINVNVNGLELDVLPPFLGGDSGLADTAAEDNSGANSFAAGNDDGSQISDFRFICINNNNNTVIEGEEEPIPPTPPEPLTTANLTVIKNTNCGFGQVICNSLNLNPQITVTGINAIPSSFPAAQTPVDVTLDAGKYSVSEAGFIPSEVHCGGFQGGQLIPGQQTFYMCTNFNDDCKGNIIAGQELTCTIDNTVIIVD